LKKRKLEVEKSRGAVKRVKPASLTADIRKNGICHNSYKLL